MNYRMFDPRESLAPAGVGAAVPGGSITIREILENAGLIKKAEAPEPGGRFSEGTVDIGTSSKILSNGKSLEEMAKVYADNVKSNKKWSWNKDVLDGDKLSIKDKKAIKDAAIAQGLIPEVKVTKVDGMKFGFADFQGAGVVHETVELPEELWKATDAVQFKWLDEAIGGNRAGMTWHHTEIPGKMELVETGIHDIVPHNGGRSTGMWADAPR